MHIRPVTPSDSALEISAVYEKTWKSAYKDILLAEYLASIPEGFWAERIFANGRKNLVAVSGGRIVGTANFCAARWERFSGFGEIASIHVLPEYEGNGIGTRLISSCLDGLAAAGFPRVMLRVLEENHAARSFYEKNGFVCTGDFFEETIGGKVVREVVYERRFCQSGNRTIT